MTLDEALQAFDNHDLWSDPSVWTGAIDLLFEIAQSSRIDAHLAPKKAEDWFIKTAKENME